MTNLSSFVNENKKDSSFSSETLWYGVALDHSSGVNAPIMCRVSVLRSNSVFPMFEHCSQKYFT
jgi:hypothetical protein